MELRVGAAGAGDGGRGAARRHAGLVDARSLPDAVHLLVVPLALLAGAAADGTRARVVVLLADPAGLPTDPADVGDAASALGAEVVLAGLPGHDGDGTADVLGRVVDALVDGAPLGEALALALRDVTTVAGDPGLLWADLGALIDPFGGRGAGAEPDMAAPPTAEPPEEAVPPEPVPPEPVPPEPVPPEPVPQPEPSEQPGPDETETRWLQCTVTPRAKARAARTGAPPNAFCVGQNTVAVFIDEPHEEAIGLSALTDADLGFKPDVDDVRLGVALVPLSPPGPPRRASIVVPRFGASTVARLTLTVPEGTREVSARLLVLHRNRVLYTAVLAGAVGHRAQLGEHTLVRPNLTGLRDRRRFDVAIVANHDAAGRAGLMAYRDGRATSVEVATMDELTGVLTRLRELLIDAAFLPPPRRGSPARWGPEEVALLVQLALRGRDLHAFLEAHLRAFGEDPRRIQVITARSGAFLPLELAYTRPAPDDDARLCPSWAAGGADCGPDCGDGPEDTTIVCPAAFLGVRATIERHYAAGTAEDAWGGGGRQYLTTATPTKGRRRLTVRHAVLATSEKVSAADVRATLKVLGGGTPRAKTWTEWTRALAAADTDVLVLLPHTTVVDAASILEISASTLDRARIERRHVTGGRTVRPLVLLLGCDTAGTALDPGGFATRFLQRDAAVVLSALTMLDTSHAARLAERTVTALREAAADRRRTPLGDLVTAVRRTAVADGLVSALAVTAYGDADWTV